MIDVAHAARSLAGAWQLVRLDANGLRLFDATPEGFWKSFQAALIAAPGYALIVWMRVNSGSGALSDDPMRALLIETIGYVIGWTAFPLCAWYLTRLFDRTQRYFQLAVAWNWANVIQLAVFLPVAFLNYEQVPGAGVIAFIVMVAIFYYQTFIARQALGLDVLPALAFVSLDLALSLVLDAFETAMHLR